MLITVVLPTALRPPQQPPNTSAELSPDAPPDPDQESIVAALNRGTSATAGAATGAGDEVDAGGAPSSASPAPPAPLPPPRFCPSGFGDPPRQVESAYSALCAGAWQGDNGGATWKGVTPDEVRIVYVNASGGADNAIGDDEDPVIASEPREGESAAYKKWRLLQQYLNQNFQFWGRRLQFVVLIPDDDAAAVKAAAVAAEEEYRGFGIYSDYEPALREAARRRMIGMGGWHLAGELYRDNQPYLTSWQMDGDPYAQVNAEYICKKLAGRPAAHAGPGVQGQPRKFGMLIDDFHVFGRHGGWKIAELAERRCGVDIKVQAFGFDGGSTTDSRRQAFATAISSFRAEGVTTIAVATDALFINQFTQQADTQGYYPEWYLTGSWCTDMPILPHVYGYSRTQWAHAFGITLNPMVQRTLESEDARAYRTVDPAGGTFGGNCFQHFWKMLQVANGIQTAGPNLTPETFRAGLDNMGKRFGHPVYWTMGGGYGPGDHSYADDVAEIWWDNSAAPNPQMEGAVGSYRYVDCGRRYRIGEVPAGDPKVFTDVTSTCLEAPG